MTCRIPASQRGKHNNRKQTFDAACRELLFSIAQSHGLQLEHEPEYGGRAYLEKQDFILMKQKEQMTRQEEKLEELTLKLEDVETLLDDVAEAAYDKAVEVVTDVVQAETRNADIAILDEYQERINRSKNSPQTLKIANQILNKAREKLATAAAAVAKKVAAFLYRPEVREAGKAEIRKKAKTSILDRLAEDREQSDHSNQKQPLQKSNQRKHEVDL